MLGLACPNCGMTTQHRVTDSRPGALGNWRRRKCNCGNSFSTIETVIPNNKGPLNKKATIKHGTKKET